MTQERQLSAGLIGCGYWGPNILRNLQASTHWSVEMVCDLDEDRLAWARAHYPAVRSTGDYREVVESPLIDAVVIATPVSTHFELARAALEAGKHVWVEKPLTARAEDARALVELAEERELLLHVDHTYVYTPAVRRIKTLFAEGELGDVLYIDSVRVSLGLFQHDVNVIWDLAPHDLSILTYLTGEEPSRVAVAAKAHYLSGPPAMEDIAYLTLEYGNECMAHIHINWLSPVKVRRILIGGSKKMLLWDDLDSSERIKVYDTGVKVMSTDDVYETLVQYRTGDMWSPKVENREALAIECEHFYESILAGTPTITDGRAGLSVVRVLEAAQQSISCDGGWVEIPPMRWSK